MLTPSIINIIVIFRFIFLYLVFTLSLKLICAFISALPNNAAKKGNGD